MSEIHQFFLSLEAEGLGYLKAHILSSERFIFRTSFPLEITYTMKGEYCFWTCRTEYGCYIGIPFSEVLEIIEDPRLKLKFLFHLDLFS